MLKHRRLTRREIFLFNFVVTAEFINRYLPDIFMFLLILQVSDANVLTSQAVDPFHNVKETQN